VKPSDDPSTSQSIGDAVAAEALANVREQGGSLAGLRTVWESRQRAVWAEDISIYRLAVGSALKLGEAFLAYDIAREGLSAFVGDVRLLQLQALALARTGATQRANAILVELREQGQDDARRLLGFLRVRTKIFGRSPRQRRRANITCAAVSKTISRATNVSAAITPAST
jgi:hypothetical protein